MHSFQKIKVPKGKIGIHWFGQSSFAFKNHIGDVIQLDPYFPLWRPAEEFIHIESPLDETSLPSDAVLITHDHRDHNCPESNGRFLIANKSTKYFASKEVIERLILARIPNENCDIVTAGSSFKIGSFSIDVLFSKPIGGAPSEGISPPDVEHLGFVISTGDRRIYVSGDPIRNFSDNQELIDAVKTLKPRIGIMTTHPSEGEFPDFADSWKMAEKIGLQTVIPAHFDCFIKRTYNPKEWAQHSRPGIEPVIMSYNSSLVF